MSAQTRAFVPGVSSPSRTPLYSGVAVTGSASIAAGLGFAAVYILNQAIEPGVLVLTSAVGMGVASGLSARFSLPGRGATLRWLVALFGLCTGLIFLGWLSRGLLGMDLIGHQINRPDWDGLMRFGIGAVTAWPAVSAWTRKRRPLASAASGNGVVPARARTSRHRNLRGNARVASTRSLSMARSAPRSRASTTRVIRSRGTRVGKARSKSVAVKGSRRTKRRIGASIQLAQQIEHRCPYCLEDVKPGDPRGVVECSTCHTLHHGDCWSVTGTCQVPHHNG